MVDDEVQGVHVEEVCSSDLELICRPDLLRFAQSFGRRKEVGIVPNALLSLQSEATIPSWHCLMVPRRS